MAAYGEGGGGSRDQLVLATLLVRGRQERGLGGAAYGGTAELLGQPGRLPCRDSAPPHAQVTLDRAGHRRGGHHLAGQTGVLRIESYDGVDVGRRSPDVDHHHVAGRLARQHLDPGEHEVRGGPLHHGGEVGPGAEPLAADDVLEEHLADRAPGRLGCQHADPRHHVVGQHVRRPRVPRRSATAPCASTSPATTTGPLHRARASEPASSTSPSELPPSVPPTSSSTSGRDSPQRRELVVVEPAGQHGHHLAAAGQRHAATGLGRHQLLVADHGDPQATAGG